MEYGGGEERDLNRAGERIGGEKRRNVGGWLGGWEETSMRARDGDWERGWA